MKSINSHIRFQARFYSQMIHVSLVLLLKYLWALVLSGRVLDLRIVYLITILPESVQGVLVDPVFSDQGDCVSIPCLHAELSELVLSFRGCASLCGGYKVQTGVVVWAAKPRTVRAMQCTKPGGASGDHSFTAPWTSFVPKVYRVNHFNDVTYSILFGRSLKNIGLTLYKFTLQPNSVKHV